MIRLLIVDDQRLVRTCICARLNAETDFSIVAEADSGELACEKLEQIEVDIVLMDLNMPGIGGMQATKELLAADPKIKVIGLSMYVTGPYPREFLALGGVGYVSKDADSQELIDAIRAVYRGESFVSQDVLSGLENPESAGDELDLDLAENSSMTKQPVDS